MKPLTVGQAAALTGVTARTLRYYDQIGLLSPAAATESGYRLYGEAELKRLQQILFFRELGFPLKEILKVMDTPGYDSREALLRQKKLLCLEQRRLKRLEALIDHTLKGEDRMDFDAFDRTEIENARRQYADEVRQRWGNTGAYAESERRTGAYSQEDWGDISVEEQELYQRFLDAMAEGPAGAGAQEAVQAWQEHITRRYYRCTDEILKCLGEMYAADPRFTANIDRRGEGLARFMSEAIRLYCEKRPQKEEDGREKH